MGQTCLHMRSIGRAPFAARGLSSMLGDVTFTGAAKICSFPRGTDGGGNLAGLVPLREKRREVLIAAGNPPVSFGLRNWTAVVSIRDWARVMPGYPVPWRRPGTAWTRTGRAVWSNSPSKASLMGLGNCSEVVDLALAGPVRWCGCADNDPYIVIAGRRRVSLDPLGRSRAAWL